MDKPKKTFSCPHCSEKPFTTKANMIRHISRKHKNIENELEVNDNVSVLSESTKSESNPMDYILDVPDSPQPDPIPSDEYLLTLRNEYKKYEYLYEKIDRKERWIKNNRDIDMIRYYQKHNRFVKCILTDIKDLYAVPING